MELNRQMPDNHDTVTFYIDSNEFTEKLTNHTAAEFVAQRFKDVVIRENDLIVIYLDRGQTHNMSAELMKGLMKTLHDQFGCKVVCMPAIARVATESKQAFINLLKETITYLEKGDDNN